MKKRKKMQAPAKFKVRDKVRVKQGVIDVDYPDIPLGGWSGTVSEVDDDSIYTVRWDKKTVDSIHPVFKNRCENDGMELEEYWLTDDDLELNDGTPVPMQQPTNIVTKPISLTDEDDRIRMAFGLTSDDPIPWVEDDHLKVYHEYLRKNIRLPFNAEYDEENPFKNELVVKVSSLDPVMIDDMCGIILEAREGRKVVHMPLADLEVGKKDPNRQLIEDYRCWFWNNR